MKYEEIELVIPTSWNDITIRMYQQFVNINKKKYSNEEEKAVDLVCTLCNVTRDELSRFSYKDLKYIVERLYKVMESKMDKETLIKKVEFQGIKHGLIPNFSAISLGEFIDIENHCQDAHNNLHKLMYIMYRPIIKERGERYSIKEYMPDQFKEEDYLDFPILAALSSLGKQLKLALLKYSKREVDRKIIKLKKLRRSGVGIM